VPLAKTRRHDPSNPIHYWIASVPGLGGQEEAPNIRNLN
jgi:hypothetical protein